MSEEQSITNQPRQNEPLRSLLFILGGLAVLGFAYLLRGIFAALTISVVSYYILEPIARYFEGKKLGKHVAVSRLAASLIAFLAGIMIITLFFLILIPPIVDQVERVGKNIPAYTKQVEDTFQTLQLRYQSLELPPEVQKSIRSSIEKLVSGFTYFVQHMVNKSAHFFSQIMIWFMVPFLTFYMLLEKDAVKSTLVRILPSRHQKEFTVILSQSSHALRGYIMGQLFLSLLMGIVMTIGLGLLGVKAPLLLGLIAGVTKLIPVIGIFLGCVPAAFVALSTSVSLAVWVIIIFTIIQLLENKVVLPVFLSRYVDLSPLSILLAILVGEQFGGFLGMFLATPVVAVLRVIYIHLRTKYE